MNYTADRSDTEPTASTLVKLVCFAIITSKINVETEIVVPEQLNIDIADFVTSRCIILGIEI